jgi:hypothetical protein
VSDYIIEEPKDKEEDAPVEAQTASAPFNPETPMTSLAAITDIRTEDTM